MITQQINRIDEGWTSAHFNCYSADVLNCNISRHTVMASNISINIKNQALAEHFPVDHSLSAANISQ